MLAPNRHLLAAATTRDPHGLSPAWNALVSTAIEPAGHNSPELLAPFIHAASAAELATVGQDGRLAFVLPVAPRRWPVPVLASWTSPVTNMGLPHVDRAQAVEAIGAFLEAAGRPVLFRSVPASGPFREALAAAAGHVAVLHTWERACLRPSGSFEDWFEANFERKRRKELRRLRSRLGETGALASLSLKSDEDAVPWIEALLGLEAAGWKGRKGTALAMDPMAAAGTRKALIALHEARKLRFWRMSLDGRPIAALYAVVESGQAWLGKIAYDESFAKYSPGVLIVLDATESLFSEGGIALADSCAIPGHPMIDRLWRDRIAMADILAAAPCISHLRFDMTLAAERLYRHARARARGLYYRLSGDHPS